MKEIKNYIHLIKTNSAYKQIDEFLNKNNYINILIKKLYSLNKYEAGNNKYYK